MNTCIHYWIIERPNGPLSKGICKLCYEERDFKNYDPKMWDGKNIKLKGSLSTGEIFKVGKKLA